MVLAFSAPRHDTSYKNQYLLHNKAILLVNSNQNETNRSNTLMHFAGRPIFYQCSLTSLTHRTGLSLIFLSQPGERKPWLSLF